MDNQLKKRLSKIYELVKRGATEGEREAAKKMLDKIVSKHNIDIDQFEDLNKEPRFFTYSSIIDMAILRAVVNTVVGKPELNENACIVSGIDKRVIGFHMMYEDYITCECAYEYFRKHANKQWLEISKPILSRCRKAKTRNKKRAQLRHFFLERYLIESKLIDEQHIISVSVSEMSDSEIENTMRMQGVEGGSYNPQITNGLLLGN